MPLFLLITVTPQENRNLAQKSEFNFDRMQARRKEPIDQLDVLQIGQHLMSYAEINDSSLPNLLQMFERHAPPAPN